jgi:endonuclease/exonuclease/phosphatase family metal-dependent hydrolase
MKSLLRCALPVLSHLLLVLHSPVSQAQAPLTEITFGAYNIENYTLAGSERTRPKSGAARDAVCKVVADVVPDILGLCEVGEEPALSDLEHRLGALGMRLPHREYVSGPDPDRHLALLSRFPIVCRNSLPKVPFELNGRPELVRRGFLDVTVQINPGYRLRLVGVHLKSKLPSPAGEDLIRRCESDQLRLLVERILSEEPGTNLLVYGDLNDTQEQPSVRRALGPWGGFFSLHDLAPEDPQGHRWTHYRHFTGIYSRIDYLLANRALRPEINSAARISGAPEWKRASDHRLVYVRIWPRDR